METKRPTWNDARDVIRGLSDLYQQEDDCVLVKQISSLRKQIAEAANEKHVTAKEAIRALTQRIKVSKSKIEDDRRARLSEKMRPIEAKNAELETKVKALTLEEADLKTKTTQLQEREKEIIAELKDIEAKSEVEIRRLRNTVSLYVNSCTVGWDHKTPNKVFCTDKDASSVSTITLDPEASEFEVANKLWEMMGC
eukprot:g2894.t1